MRIIHFWFSLGTESIGLRNGNNLCNLIALSQSHKRDMKMHKRKEKEMIESVEKLAK